MIQNQYGLSVKIMFIGLYKLRRYCRGLMLLTSASLIQTNTIIQRYRLVSHHITNDDNTA